MSQDNINANIVITSTVNGVNQYFELYQNSLQLREVTQMKKRKHANLIKAWADGAEIQLIVSGEFVDYDRPSFDKHCQYRIKPDCQYAIEKVHQLGGDESVSLYVFWLNGGMLLDQCTGHKFVLAEVTYDPFASFMEWKMSGQNITKLIETIKQVLWVNDSNALLTPSGRNASYADWFNEDEKPLHPNWHIVPTCTRELEVKYGEA